MPGLRVAGGAPQGRHCKAGAAEPAACYCAADRSVWLQPGGWESISCNRTGASCCGSAQDRLPELRGAVTASGAPGKPRGDLLRILQRAQPDGMLPPRTGPRRTRKRTLLPTHRSTSRHYRRELSRAPDPLRRAEEPHRHKEGRHVCPHRLGFENDGYANMQITVSPSISGSAQAPATPCRKSLCGRRN